MGLAMYDVGDELAGSKYLTDNWAVLDKAHVLQNWPEKGFFQNVKSLFDGVFTYSGLYDTEPEGVELAILLDEAKVLSSDRAVYVGATDLTTGMYTVFNKTKDSAIHAALASSAVPGNTIQYYTKQY